jgi:hypothetical protein
MAAEAPIRTVTIPAFVLRVKTFAGSAPARSAAPQRTPRLGEMKVHAERAKRSRIVAILHPVEYAS